MSNETSPFYIFIVGVGRSGTKFFKSVLNEHPDVHITTETHFFSKALHNGFIKVADKIGSMKDDNNVRKLVDAMFTKKAIFGPFWKNQILKNKEAVLEQFLASDRSYKSFFQIILEEDRKQNNKPIGGEKTPSHLYHVPTLVKWFPSVKVVHIVRNPKNVLASEIFKETKPDYPIKKSSSLYTPGLFLYVLINWKNAIKRNDLYKKLYPQNFISIRYEDLLNDHRNTVVTVCDFLQIPFTEKILNPPVRGSSFEPGTAPVKNKEKKYMFSRQFNSMFELLLKKKMKRYNYL